MRYVFNTKVVKAEERQIAKRGYKDDNGEAHIEYEPLGYFVVLDGFREAFRVGDSLETTMNLPAGSKARLIIEIEP